MVRAHVVIENPILYTPFVEPTAYATAIGAAADFEIIVSSA